MTEHVLDNPGWHALSGPLRRLAHLGTPPIAGRFDPQVSIFAAMAHDSPEAWDALAPMLNGEVAVMFCRRTPSVPVGWRLLAEVPTAQYVAAQLATLPGPAPLELGAADAAEMQALVELTDPGPFAPRTHEMGTYLGVRRSGDLVAMAGQRFAMPGFVEISAVCVHPDARGEGLGARLTLAVAARIRADGHEAFLHVREDNPGAIELYERLGFRRRADMVVVVAAPEAAR